MAAEPVYLAALGLVNALGQGKAAVARGLADQFKVPSAFSLSVRSTTSSSGMAPAEELLAGRADKTKSPENPALAAILSMVTFGSAAAGAGKASTAMLR